MRTGVSGGLQSGRTADHTQSLVSFCNNTSSSYQREYTRVRRPTQSTEGEVRCRLCGKAPESVAHILSGCSALAQSNHLSRHDAALKVLFYELLYDEGVTDEIPPWYSPTSPSLCMSQRTLKRIGMSLYTPINKRSDAIEWMHVL